ncbi:CpsD/CapB family tyrosine-protein kinase [Pseudogracilibacillus sp. SE30717A]|uniref:CpsD/CapB family tyrosine-protein kinase n=1 Tax=Pseudogracilibacillus sp. SE30717A TaxID=3098293 RepID=UPI00300E308C
MFNRKKPAPTSKIRHLITNLNPRSPISEQYRTIRTNLQFSSVDKPLQAILITSAGPAAGKSITAANLAVVYAQQGKRTLLIDADLRKPTVHYTFRLDNLRGLSNVLIGDSTLEEAVERSDVDNLDILSCGPIPPNPSELLASKRMEEILKLTKQLYDFVIFDTPPALAVTDAKILANIVDGSLLVYRSGTTEYEEAERTAELMKDSKARLLGAILNDRSKSNSNYYYYYGS